MRNETDNRINAHLRKIYEPRYGRPLSDAEVHEIRTNLRAFAEVIVDVAERIYGKSGNLSENENRTGTAQPMEGHSL